MNEVRLIDANALKRNMEFVCMGIMAGTEPYNAPLTEIDNAPTVELNDMTAYFNGFEMAKQIHERPQGEWIDEGQYAEGHSEHAYFCKNCDYQIIEKPNMISENRFCKNCGAKMKGGAE